MIARFLVALTALCATVAVAAAGESAKIRGVVELFTSQGCNSCPKADDVMSELAKDPGLVSLAYHVDYWDYLGWRDTLASPENTQRQRDYARAMAARSVYTPQAVINGRSHENGAEGGEIRRRLGPGATLPVAVRMWKERGTVIIEIGNGEAPSQGAHVLLVTFDSALPVRIERGENAGKTVVYWNAVRGMQAVGVWNGEPARLEIPASEIYRKGNGGSAVLVQTVAEGGAPGPILGAASMHFRAHGKRKADAVKP